MIHTGKTVDRHSAAANRHCIATHSGGNRHFIAIGHMGQDTLVSAAVLLRWHVLSTLLPVTVCWTGTC
jgi:hypothetical protein